MSVLFHTHTRQKLVLQSIVLNILYNVSELCKKDMTLKDEKDRSKIRDEKEKLFAESLLEISQILISCDADIVDAIAPSIISFLSIIPMHAELCLRDSNSKLSDIVKPETAIFMLHFCKKYYFEGAIIEGDSSSNSKSKSISYVFDRELSLWTILSCKTPRPLSQIVAMIDIDPVSETIRYLITANAEFDLKDIFRITKNLQLLLVMASDEPQRLCKLLLNSLFPLLEYLDALSKFPIKMDLSIDFIDYNITVVDCNLDSVTVNLWFNQIISTFLLLFSKVLSEATEFLQVVRFESFIDYLTTGIPILQYFTLQLLCQKLKIDIQTYRNSTLLVKKTKAKGKAETSTDKDKAANDKSSSNSKSKDKDSKTKEKKDKDGSAKTNYNPRDKEEFKSVKIVPGSGGGSGASKLVAGSSWLDDIFRSGVLKPLSWMLTHRSKDIRIGSYRVFELLLSYLKSLVKFSTPLEKGVSVSGSIGNMYEFQNITIVDEGKLTEFIVATIEQAIVPLWEILGQGFPIYGVSDNKDSIQSSAYPSENVVVGLFPEVQLRSILMAILVAVSQGFSKSSSSINRIVSALIHSQQSTLRLQVAASIFYLIDRYPPLRSILWNYIPVDNRTSNNYSTTGSKKGSNMAAVSATDPAGVGGLIFKQFMMSLLKDINDFSEFLKLVAAFLTKILMHNDEVILQNRNQSVSKDREANLSKRNTVLVKFEGKLIKMQCSELKHIESHSPQLFKVVNSLPPSVQTQTSSSSSSNTELEASSSIKEYAFPVLAGSYSTWQEMFSHITSSSLMVMGIGRMSKSVLTEALVLSKLYGIHHCHRHYCDALFSKYPNFQIYEMLELCLSLDATSLAVQYDMQRIESKENMEESSRLSPVAIDMLSGVKTPLCYSSAVIDHFLLLKCIEFMIENIDVASKQLSANKALDIVDLLHIALHKLFFFR